ncbi:sialate O-acetylesterase [Clostridium hydrogenum]|uniref:sialate O-acetylesterase n=1 Tax=Clostridium hydrogenum TaxID=2855764 RepID=UPI001F157BFF|nr:sialate O-acetylesterase [Clostridium hydrogenum]
MVNNQFRLPRLISDGMVLQRNVKVKIWGYDVANEKVTVYFMDKVYNCVTASNGKWKIVLEELEAGGPYSMKIEGSGTAVIKDILIGDVWACTGQSNMQLPISRIKVIYEDEVGNARNPYIRQFIVPERYEFKEAIEDVETGEWKGVDPESILDFSGVGYFFAKALYEQYKVPIGLIKTAIGGSCVESWLSEEALKEFPRSMNIADKFKDDAYFNKVRKDDQEGCEQWYKNIDENDEGLANPEKPWFDPSCDISDWDIINLPVCFKNEKIGDLKGSVWFRKEVDLPKAMLGKPAMILLGTITDSDAVYINGKLVGTTAYQYPPRRYNIPKNLLQDGKNTIVIRVISNNGNGEFTEGKPCEITVGDKKIDLRGKWRYHIGVSVENPLPSVTFFPSVPLCLYNGILAPVTNYQIKGVIWYQGESNTDMPKEYKDMFVRLILNWREKWKQGDFPFLYVQLPNFMKAKKEPGESNWAELREAQLETFKVTKNTAMAVAIDVGEWNDLHPLNKKDVGERLALAARKVAYGEEDLVYSGPIYKAMRVEENKIVISFTDVGSGLCTHGNADLSQFSICGVDKKFVWAKAEIKDNEVVVWNEAIAKPTAVRYAWADNPEGANLYNREGLPASPFRTDKQL